MTNGGVSLLTAMTYNIGNGLARPAPLVALLRASGADVVGLQEMSDVQADAIRRDLRDVFPHQALYPAGFAGKGLLSRYPLLSQERLDLHPARPDLGAVIDVAGTQLTVIVAHPLPPRWGLRGVVFAAAVAAQIDALAALAVAGSPALLVGDFNFTPRNPLYNHLMLLGLHDAFGVAGQGHGWTLPARIGPSSRIKHRLQWVPLPPVVRIDYIWYTAPLVAEAAWVGSDAGSDHLPVLARLALPRAT